MDVKEIVISRKLVYGIGIALGILVVVVILGEKFSIFGRSQATVDNSELVAGSVEKFAFLSGQGQQPRSAGSSCGLLTTVVENMPDDARIQGSCCSAMDFQHYQEQVEGLKKYANVSQIPSDPYDVPVSLAKQLLGYDKSIELNADQQAVYDQATQLAKEHGPCCCRCWRWFAFEGQAKYLISQQNWSAQQIAAVWDLEDGCGGAG